MVPSRLDRRSLLQAVGASTLTVLAGCSGPGRLVGSGSDRREYALDVDRIDQSLVEHALYEPGDDPVFGQPARRALDAILPDGRYATRGYEPLPQDSYVRHEGRFYRTVVVVTGRESTERRLVSATPVADEDAPAEAPTAEELSRADARVVKILHSYAVTGRSRPPELLRDGAYVLRRPAERDGAIADRLDGDVVRLDDEGPAYRLRVETADIRESVYTALAVEVAPDEATFREVVFASRVDVELAPGDLAKPSRELLERAIDRGPYRETAPLSDRFTSLLDALGVGAVQEGVTGRLLWYDGDLHRYAFYTNPAG